MLADDSTTEAGLIHAWTIQKRQSAYHMEDTIEKVSSLEYTGILKVFLMQIIVALMWSKDIAAQLCV